MALIEVERDDGIRWGTGFFVSSDGILVTNRHVVNRGQKIVCLLRNQVRCPAVVLKQDDRYDLAILRVQVPQPVPTVQLGNSDALRMGQLVAVTGYPRVELLVWTGMRLDSSTSRGTVNAIRFSGDPQSFLGNRTIQIDAPVTNGNSGGPVFRLDTGEVIGVLSSVVRGAGNLTFAMPIAQASVMMSELGLQLKVKVPQIGGPELIVEPGDLRVLNVVGANKEIPQLFGRGYTFSEDLRIQPKKQAISDWISCAGEKPSAVTSPVIQGEEVFFGGLNGRLYRWNLAEMRAGADPDEITRVLIRVDEQDAFFYPPVVDDRIICACAGRLGLNEAEKEKIDWLQTLLAGTGEVATRTVREIRLHGSGRLLGFNRQSGNLDWEAETGFVSTPVLHRDRVYYGGMGERGCLNAYSGEPQWKPITRRDGANATWFDVGYAGPLGLFGTAVPVEGKRYQDRYLVLYGDGDVRVESYDPANGKQLWDRKVGSVQSRLFPLGTAMFVDEAKKRIYVLAAQIIAALDATTGKLLWTYDHASAVAERLKTRRDKTAGLFNFSPQLVIHEGIVYVGSGDRKLYALNGQDGKELWSFETRGQVGHPVFHEGQILVGSEDGYIYAVDAASGNLVWRFRSEQPVRTQPLVHQGMIFAATEDGQLLTIRIPAA